MNDLTLFKTPSGDEMVVLERRRYDALIAAEEMLQDVAAYDGAKARLASGEDELAPAAVANAILAGENPMRTWRRHRGLTIADLADRTGLSVSYLSQMETGARQGAVDKLSKVATALGLGLDDLV